MKTLNLTLFSLVAVSLCVPCLAKDTDAQQIRSLYAKMVQAIRAKNMTLATSLEAPGYSETVHGKLMKKSEVDAQMGQMMKMITKINSMDLKLSDISVSGKAAHVKTSFSMSASFKDQQGKLHSIKESGTTSDTLVKTSNGWRFLSEVHTADKAWMDGKLVPTS